MKRGLTGVLFQVSLQRCFHFAAKDRTMIKVKLFLFDIKHLWIICQTEALIMKKKLWWFTNVCGKLLSNDDLNWKRTSCEKQAFMFQSLQSFLDTKDLCEVHFECNFTISITVFFLFLKALNKPFPISKIH